MVQTIRQGPFKFLFIAKNIIPIVGGAERSMVTLMHELRKRGHTVNHICSENYDKSLERTAQHHDIIITQLQWSPMAVKIAEQYNKPSIIMMRSLEPVCRVVHNPNEARLIAECGQKCWECPHRITGYESHGIALNKCNLILGNSQWSAEWMVREHHHSPDKVGWIYPCMDFAFLDEEVKHKPEYISMSMWTYSAGTDVFVGVAKRMPKEKFRIYGYKYDLPSFPRYNLPKNVEFIQNAPQEEMFGTTKLWLFPYRTIPNFGRVILEALKADIPVVGIKAGAIIPPDEMIIDGVNGYTVEGHDAGKWVSKVKEALKDIEKLRKGCKDTDYYKFSKESGTDRFVDYSAQVLNNRTR